MKTQIHPPENPLQWLRLYLLYRQAFPGAERKPFSIIVRMYRKGKSDVWYLERDGQFVGFASTVNADTLILLDYLAVDKGVRGQGVGAAALALLQKHYSGKGLFVEIESPYEASRDQALRLRRKRFYRRCGFRPLNVMASVFGVKMELLGYGCEMTFDAYRAFYRDHYSAFAAEHIEKAPHPESSQDE